MHLGVTEFNIKNQERGKKNESVINLCEEVEHETSEAISEYKVCNKLEDDIRSGMLIDGACSGNPSRWL